MRIKLYAAREFPMASNQCLGFSTTNLLHRSSLPIFEYIQQLRPGNEADGPPGLVLDERGKASQVFLAHLLTILGLTW